MKKKHAPSVWERLCSVLEGHQERVSGTITIDTGIFEISRILPFARKKELPEQLCEFIVAKLYGGACRTKVAEARELLEAIIPPVRVVGRRGRALGYKPKDAARRAKQVPAPPTETFSREDGRGAVHPNNKTSLTGEPRVPAGACSSTRFGKRRTRTPGVRPDAPNGAMVRSPWIAATSGEARLGEATPPQTQDAGIKPGAGAMARKPPEKEAAAKTSAGDSGNGKTTAIPSSAETIARTRARHTPLAMPPVELLPERDWDRRLDPKENALFRSVQFEGLCAPLMLDETETWGRIAKINLRNAFLSGNRREISAILSEYLNQTETKVVLCLANCYGALKEVSIEGDFWRFSFAFARMSEQVLKVVDKMDENVRNAPAYKSLEPSEREHHEREISRAGPNFRRKYAAVLAMNRFVADTPVRHKIHRPG